MEDNHTEDSLGDSPEENLHIENELLKLKMQAELGALFHSENDLPPAMENMFLKNILAFHQSAENQKTIKIFDKISNPKIKKAVDLTDEQITEELAALNLLLENNNIEVSYLYEYDNRKKYVFLTEELFDVEIDDVTIEGMKNHFIYEEFHPNHEADIKKQAEVFINAWFNQTITTDNWELSDEFVLPERKTLSKQQVVDQIHNIFSLSSRFINGRYDIIDTSFQLMDNDRGMGYAEGALGYRVVLANGETEVISGPFKLYFALEYGYWQIIHLVFPGFSY
ncbi:hypothetical protein [Pedobacter cryotolerans]|uniref:Uncharacterized protein n=1 Tax=Pedobacter cryotolerans TaxID=2571270 RepID=A0A4U1C4K4_9SPHI|nr:hypothetical protein [Pedobacter cryotolerans]TKB99317.1 hypothetical protein FA045_12565 [Pedobacter cryotolerans]